jgi:hypothetical protein
MCYVYCIAGFAVALPAEKLADTNGAGAGCLITQ